MFKECVECGYYVDIYGCEVIEAGGYKHNVCYHCGATIQEEITKFKEVKKKLDN